MNTGDKLLIAIQLIKMALIGVCAYMIVHVCTIYHVTPKTPLGQVPFGVIAVWLGCFWTLWASSEWGKTK